jgi:methylmalonyl-CoA/ethylmalonyl-CoA epimerase
MKIKRISHVAVAVENIDEAAPKLARILGSGIDHREVVASQRVEAAMFPLGETGIELIEPKGNEGISKFLEKRGPGLHHVALEVEGIDELLGVLKAAGVRLIDESPRVGAGGHRVAFVHPGATGGVLIELVEPHDEGPASRRSPRKQA